MLINFSASNTLIFNTIIPSRTSKKIISFFEDFLNLPTSTPTELNAHFAELHYTSFTSYHRIQGLNYTLADYNVSFSFVRPVFFNHFFSALTYTHFHQKYWFSAAVILNRKLMWLFLQKCVLSYPQMYINSAMKFIYVYILHIDMCICVYRQML